MNRSLLALLILLCLGCKDEGTPPPPYVPSITLEAVDASCTEAWLRASTTATPATVRLLRDNQRVADLRLLTADSLLIDDNLLPNHQYSYQLQKLGNDSNVVETCASVRLTTMDTTSHDFIWEIDTLGDGSSSVLYDVAIINDTLAYAVGAIYLRDSVGNWDPNAYNMVKWNGTRWELMRLQFYTFCNQPSTGSYPAKSIFAFSATDIWISSGTQVVRWNGQSQSPPTCTPISINKLWGENPNSVYAVGNGGGIAHYANGVWQDVESETNIRLLDIWGTPDGNEVWTCGWQANTGDNVVLRKESLRWLKVSLPPSILESELLGTLWMQSSSEVLITGSGDVFGQSLLNLELIRRYPVNLGYYAYRIRGSARNDVTLVGDGSMVWHWNGVSWHRYGVLFSVDDRLYGLSVSPTMILAVGTRLGSSIDREALIWIGKE